MIGSLEDTIAKWFVVEHRFAPDYARETAVEVVAMVRAASVVPAEPATHNTPRWEAHRSYGIRDTVSGGTLWCHDADQEPSSAVRDATLAALAAVDGEAPATMEPESTWPVDDFGVEEPDGLA